MKTHSGYYLSILLFFFLSAGCKKQITSAEIDKDIQYCITQAYQTIESLPGRQSLPGTIEKTDTCWQFTSPGTWTSGFWPGILWYIYEITKEDYWKSIAEDATATLFPMTHRKAYSHDSGFITMCSFGNGYRLTGNKEYKEALLRAADSLAVLYNPVVGTILSWPRMVEIENWPHNTIIDNMMNLELLLWASRNGGDAYLREIAIRHAETTLKNHFRPDYSSYHVVVYDTITGSFIKGVTHQGLGDETMWARGQAWAIYGYTLMYRETATPEFLQLACKATEVYLNKLPDDLIPYWDFNAIDISVTEPRDVSAAAITASALLELSTYISSPHTSARYRKIAEKILQTLSSPHYQSGEKNTAFLLHSVGHMPQGKEVDASIIYADYYYLEALVRLKRLQAGIPVLESL